MLLKRSFSVSSVAQSPGGSCRPSAMVDGYTDMKPSHLFEGRTSIERMRGAVGKGTENDTQTSLGSGGSALSRPISAL